jgi:hypothetical protein
MWWSRVIFAPAGASMDRWGFDALACLAITSLIFEWRSFQHSWYVDGSRDIHY